MIKFINAADEREAGLRAAEIFSEVIHRRPDAVLGLATGSTPQNMYAELIKMYRSGMLSFKRVRTVNLDEYLGLPPTHVQSYAAFMRNNLFSHIDLDPSNSHLPSGVNDPMAECEDYDRLLDRLGRIDIQLLGLGHNGHIAFNEPSKYFSEDTSTVSLAPSTVSANSRFFDKDEQIPTKAISMGIARILRARRILLLVTGEGKAEILERSLFGRITPAVPASALRLYTGELTVVTDPAARSVIEKNHPSAIKNNS